jgi:hypothetical protein
MVESAAELGSDHSSDRRIEVCTGEGHVLTIPLTAEIAGVLEPAHLVPADAQGRLQTAEMFIW